MKLLRFFVASGLGVSAFQSPAKINSRFSFSSTARHFAFVNIQENAPRDIESVIGWADSCGVQKADGFQFTSDDGIDVSVMTNQNLPANTPVLQVPEGMILSSQNAMKEFGKLIAAETVINGLGAKDELPYFYLMVKILIEYEKGDQSPWYYWLNSLPRYFSNGASMTSFCFECLPPLAASLATKERKNLIALSNVNKVPFLSDQIKASKELCKWAFQIAYTRSFEANDGSGDLRIAPMADMFNHGTDAEISISYDQQGNLMARTTRDVPAGSPLRISYGDPTNPSFLFARYGFLDETSPATFCKIMIPHVDKKLEEMGYVHNRMLFYKDTGEVSPEVYDVLLYQILSSSNAKRRTEFYNAHILGDEETKKRYHDHYWPETIGKLQHHIDNFLYDLEKLSAKPYSKNANLNEHPRLPLIMKHNEYVKNTFLTVRQRLLS